MRRAALVLWVLAAAGCNCSSKVSGLHLALAADPRTLDFGVVPSGTLVQRTVTLAASGGRVEIDAVSIRDDLRGSFSVGAAPDGVELGSPVTVTVSYLAASEGPDAASLVVALGSDGLPELVIPLVGRALGEVDGGFDAGFDGGTDAGADAGFDAGTDAGVDGGADAGHDAGTPFDGGLITFDGGACAANAGLGNTRWTSFGKAYFPEALWNGSGYDAIFYDLNESYAGHVDVLGQSVGTQTTITGSPGALSGLIRSARGDGGVIGIIFADDRAGLMNRATYFAEVSPQLQPISGTEVLVAANTIDAPNIAYNPVDQEWGVMFTTWSSNLFFIRVDRFGQVIAGSQKTLSNTAQVGRSGDTRSLVFHDEVWAVAWSESTQIVLQEIDRAGDPIAASKTVVVSNSQAFDPAIGVGPSEYLVGWQDNRNTVQNARVRVARVSFGGGLVANSEEVLGPDAGISDSVDIVWDGTQYFVAHEQQDGVGQRIAIATVDVNGVITTPSHIVTCPTSDDEFSPRISWNGQLHLITYTYQGSVVEGRALLVP